MKTVIKTEKKAILLWLDDIEDGAMEQVKNIANLPFTYRHVAVMPDAHQGYGMPIGGVLATKGYIVPNAVGVDIGCGMCAVQTSLKEIGRDNLKKIMGLIRKRIPVGFSHHQMPQSELLMPWNFDQETVLPEICSQQYTSALTQLGTLGGGNHFIEIQKGSDGYIWIMIHSGSRNLGKKVADHYNKIAEELNRSWFSAVPQKYELAFLPIGSKVGKLYYSEMKYCVEFALANRRLMIERVKESFLDVCGELEFGDLINIAHNYAAIENHFGENVIVHRKGATRAYKNEFGIIPGSQGSSSFIVIGKGNVKSFKSCSHGAGRKMGRRQAQKQLSLADEIEKLDSLGVIHGIRTTRDLDEAPGSYKDISVVMANQMDLVDIEVELTPLAVIKG